MKLNIIISTAPRRINTLDQCIESVRKEWKEHIDLVVGGKDVTYVKKYTHSDGFYTYAGLWEKEKNLKTIQRAAYGYFQCLTIDKKTPALIIEDDVVLADNWLQSLESILPLLKQERFILSFVTPWEEAVDNPHITTPTVQQFRYLADLTYPSPGAFPEATVVTWCNTSAVYYPPSVLQSGLPEFVEQFAVQGKAVYDLAIGHYAFRMNIPIYIVVPNLARNLDLPNNSAMGDATNRKHDDYSNWPYTKYI